MTDKRVWRGSETIHLTPTEFKIAGSPYLKCGAPSPRKS